MADEEIVGHGGEGSDCVGKTVTIAGKGALAATIIGAVEACFLPQQFKSTTPLLFTSLKLMGKRGAMGGAIFGTFAAAACVTAFVRDRDDYVNAFVVRSVPWTLGLSLGGGALMATTKLRNNTYFPPLPRKEATSQYPLPWTNEKLATGPSSPSH